MNIVLWIVQIVLALLFLAAGFFKTFMPIENLAKNMAWTREVHVALVRFIGISEILGAIGLIVPPLTHILPWLAIAAAVGLVLIMILAVIFHASRKEYSSIGMNAVLFVLALLVVYGRFGIVPF